MSYEFRISVSFYISFLAMCMTQGPHGRRARLVTATCIAFYAYLFRIIDLFLATR